MKAQNKLYKQILKQIGRVLLEEWDPINVKDVPEAQDEYNGYITRIYRLIESGASEYQLAEHLHSIEVNEMGYSTSVEALIPISQKLLSLKNY